MLVLPVHTPLLQPGDDLAALLHERHAVQSGDIIALSSKAVATCEGAAMDLTALPPSPEAALWAKRCGRSAAFCEAVLQETARLHGTVRGACPGALLTELRPEGRGGGSIVAVNAGLDESNTALGTAIGWPVDPVSSAQRFLAKMPAGTGMVITDSCCIPRRKGVTAYALVTAGFDPHASAIGAADLYGRMLTVTVEAMADQLAVSANCVMGNADQRCPMAIIREHPAVMSTYCGWVPGMEAEQDVFRDIYR